MRWLCLAGHMGSGKTAVGRRVASRLDWPFVDADRRIEAAVGMPIADIFSTRGEVWFRRTEEATLRELLTAPPPGVLALGGGALESARTRDLLVRVAWVVWLRASVDVAWGRVRGSERPLAADRARFARRAEAREPIFRAAADLAVDADGPPEDVAARVAAWALGRAQAEVAS
jgi:shikimate kinase